VRNATINIELQNNNPPWDDSELLLYAQWLKHQLPWILKKFPYVKKQGCIVDLSDNTVGPQGVDKLLLVLREEKVPCMTFKAYRNLLDDSIIDTFVEYLYTQPESNPLQGLHISHNRITEKGWRRLFECAAKCKHYPRKATGQSDQRFPLWLRLESNAIDDPPGLVASFGDDKLDGDLEVGLCLMEDGCCSRRDCKHASAPDRVIHVSLPHFLTQDVHNERRDYEHGAYATEADKMAQLAADNVDFSEQLIRRDEPITHATGGGGLTVK